MAQSLDPILKTVKTLSAQKPLAIDDVVQATGLKLAAVSIESTPFYSIYKSEVDDKKPWADAEFRKPKNLGKFGQNLLILHVGGGKSIDEASVRAVFGKEDTMEFPRPDASADVPTYLIYHLDERKLSFGFVGGSKPVLKTVIVDDIPVN